jgi:hypothetical protein
VPTVKKSQASVAVACARRNSGQVGPELLGAGPVPCRRKMAHTLEGESRTPMVASSPWIRRYPQVGFSLARRRTTETVPIGNAGRPGRRPRGPTSVVPDLGASAGESQVGQRNVLGERPRAARSARPGPLGPRAAGPDERLGGARQQPRGGAQPPRRPGPVAHGVRDGAAGGDEGRQGRGTRGPRSLIGITITPRKSRSKGRMTFSAPTRFRHPQGNLRLRGRPLVVRR